MNMIEREWKPINTAPTDIQVRLGRWEELGSSGLQWRTSTGTPFKRKRGMFGSYRSPEFDSVWYSHWQPLPPPPAALTQESE